METVTINITRASILADMKVKSHAEVALIVDEKERYLAELGSEKVEEAQQDITDAAAEIASILRPFLTFSAGTETATDTYDTTATITYVLSVTSRKSPGLANALMKAIHAYIVDSALEKFYNSVSRTDLAQRHLAQQSAALPFIENLLYRRKSPTYTT
jgi:hypothetical protein